MSLPCRYKLVLRESVLLLVVFLNIGSQLAMVGVGGRVLGGSPHVHEAEEEQEVIETPHALVHAASHVLPAPLQPLEPPRVGHVLVVHQIAEHDQRNRGNHHAHQQQRVQTHEHRQLRVLLVLPQLVHRVHQALEHPEVHQRVQSPVSATGQPYPAVMYTRTWLSVSGTSERTARSESQSETAK